MKRWLIAFLPIAVIVALVAYAVGSHVVPQSVQDNLANAASASGSGATLDDNLADALPEAPVNAQSVAPPVGNVATPAVENDMTAASAASAPAADAGDPDAEAQARREIGAEIRRATIAALDSGAATHWHKDGLAGDIVVSDPQDEGQNLTCRTVSATMGTDEDRRQSGDHVWCQSSDGGDWTPQ